MKKVMYKIVTFAAIVGLAVPVSQVHAQNQADVLPVVSLVPENQSPQWT